MTDIIFIVVDDCIQSYFRSVLVLPIYTFKLFRSVLNLPKMVVSTKKKLK